MGQHSRSESLFYFRVEDQIPENHLLRFIDRHISVDFLRAKPRDSYSEKPVHPSPELAKGCGTARGRHAYS